MTPPLLDARNITRTLDGDIPATLVANANVTINNGEFITITGPSGSGKSSLLYLLGLLDRPTTGDVFLNGQSTVNLNDDARAALRRVHMGFVFQFHFLLPEFSALENVMMPLRKLGRDDDKTIAARATELLTSLGLGDKIDRLPKQLSGGQSQRVAIARALACNPSMILADEPTGNLDTAASRNVQDILLDLVTTHGKTVIFVTHDENFATRAHRTIHMIDGKIVP